MATQLDSPSSKNANSPDNWGCWMRVSAENRPRVNERAGTRTQDLRIKSPLLYQLSYALAYPNRRFEEREVSEWGGKFQFAVTRRSRMPFQTLPIGANEERICRGRLLNNSRIAGVYGNSRGEPAGVGWQAETVQRS